MGGSLLLVKRRHLKVKSGFCTQETMFGVSFKQQKCPSHKQDQGSLGPKMVSFALAISDSKVEKG